MTTIDTTRRIGCGKVYRGHSKPVYAADARGVVVGTLHASCGLTAQSPYTHGRYLRDGERIEMAQRWAYTRWRGSTKRPREDRDMAWWAEMLLDEARGPDDALLAYDEHQQHLVDHWSTRPTRPIPREALDAAYRALVAEYRAWKAVHYHGAPPPPDAATLVALLAALTEDEMAPWGATAYEDAWECRYCDGHMDYAGEPGDEGHAATCPWLAARRLVRRA